jgi:ATP-dependent Clp protease ATP-binding subunit ClpC
MTSNLGADRIQEHARRDESFEELKIDLMEILRRSFRPEFINRIDEIIVFRGLSEEQIREITRLLLDRLARRLRAQQIEIEFTDDAIELLAREGYDREFGARPLRRTIQRMVENELSRLVLGGKVDAGDRVRVDSLEGELHFDVQRSEATESREEAAQPEAVES